MWELDYKGSWAPKNWCFWTVVLEKTVESPLDCKEIQPVHPKGDQSWVFTGRTGVEAKTPILRPPDAKSWLIWRDPDVGKDWGQEDKGRQRMRWLDDSVDMSMRNSRSWWWTGRPGVLWFMGSQRVGHNWSTELNWVLLKLWRPSIPSYIHLNRSLNKTQESHWASSVCHSVTWRFLCLWVQVVSLWHLDSELLIHTVNAAIVLSGFLSILIFTVSHITLWSKHYIIFKAKAFLSIFR